ncbi:MAG: carbohydrate kinase family protein [Anaerolineae bacterium]
MVDYVVIGNIIIDDIVLPDGTTLMNTLGGAGTHAVMGIRVWSDRVGFISAVGVDFPTDHWAALVASGVDLIGVRREKLPTPRAWQLFEANGKRTEVFRTNFDDLLHLEAEPKHFPLAYVGVRGAYILTDRPDTLHSWVSFLRSMGVSLILWEPSPYWMNPQQRERFVAFLSEVDIVCPDLESARCLYAETDAYALIRAMLYDGARLVALRMGKEGSLIAERGGQIHAIPIWPTKVVDVTGAGNAYCGGLLVGYAETGDARTAGLYGAVSASFAVEQFGPISWRPDLSREARCRLGALQSTILSQIKDEN